MQGHAQQHGSPIARLPLSIVGHSAGVSLRRSPIALREATSQNL